MAKQEGPGIPAPSVTQPIGPLDIVSAETWEARRAAFLVEEKAFMKARDALMSKRRGLPLMEVQADYQFAGADGDADLLGLFQGRRQLIVYRLFYAPDVENWPDGACTGCSMFVDAIPHPAHLAARDTSLAIVTAAPWENIVKLRKRMGWEHIPFYALPLENDRFSRDFDLEEMFGLNVFVRDGEKVYRSYSMRDRGVEDLGSVWSFLDLTPLGRQEEWQDMPEKRPQGEAFTWWRLHDNYGEVAEPLSPPPR